MEEKLYYCSADDNGGEIEQVYAKSAKEAAEKLVGERDWYDGDSTIYISVGVSDSLDEDGEFPSDIDHYQIALEPKFPLCMSYERGWYADETRDHNWQTVSLFGKGGGTVCRERCSRCGLEKVSDSWANYEGVEGCEITTIKKDSCKSWMYSVKNYVESKIHEIESLEDEIINKIIDDLEIESEKDLEKIDFTSLIDDVIDDIKE